MMLFSLTTPRRHEYWENKAIRCHRFTHCHSLSCMCSKQCTSGVPCTSPHLVLHLHRSSSGHHTLPSCSFWIHRILPTLFMQSSSPLAQTETQCHIQNLPGGSTLQCDTWLWDHVIEFSRWQHPAMWHVTVGEIKTLNSPGGSTLQCDTRLCDDMALNVPKRLPYWNSSSGFDFDHITAVDMSFSTSLRNFIQIGPPTAEKWRVSIFKMADLRHLWFRAPIMGSLKSLCRTSYRSSIETTAVNALFLRKLRFLRFRERQTDGRTNRWTAPMH